MNDKNPLASLITDEVTYRKKISDHIDSLLAELVQFKLGDGTMHYGWVINAEQGVLNIKGIEQAEYTMPDYHFAWQKCKKVTTKQAYKLGRAVAIGKIITNGVLSTDADNKPTLTQ